MSLDALSPLDGRYADQTRPLAAYFSEAALIRYRVLVEVEWLIAMADGEWMPEVRALTADERDMLRGIVSGFGEADAARVKDIERTTRHDVKAVEYLLRERLAGTSLEDVAG